MEKIRKDATAFVKDIDTLIKERDAMAIECCSLYLNNMAIEISIQKQKRIVLEKEKANMENRLRQEEDDACVLRKRERNSAKEKDSLDYQYEMLQHKKKITNPIQPVIQPSLQQQQQQQQQQDRSYGYNMAPNNNLPANNGNNRNYQNGWVNNNQPYQFTQPHQQIPQITNLPNNNRSRSPLPQPQPQPQQQIRRSRSPVDNRRNRERSPLPSSRRDRGRSPLPHNKNRWDDSNRERHHDRHSYASSKPEENHLKRAREEDNNKKNTVASPSRKSPDQNLVIKISRNNSPTSRTIVTYEPKQNREPSPSRTIKVKNVESVAPITSERSRSRSRSPSPQQRQNKKSKKSHNKPKNHVRAKSSTSSSSSCHDPDCNLDHQLVSSSSSSSASFEEMEIGYNMDSYNGMSY